MARYRYEAIDAAGRVQRGEMEAGSESEVAGRIQAQGSMLLRAAPPTALSAAFGLLNFELTSRRGLNKRTLTALTRELALLLGAGQGIDHALRFMGETARDPAARRLLADLRERVRGGKSVASAFAAHPETFSRLYVGMVTAGEAGGTLAETLAQLATLLERERSLATTLQSALVYPVILVIAAIASVAFLVGWVLPQFAQVFAQAGANLPWATRALLALGDGMQANSLLLLTGLAATAAALMVLWRYPPLRGWRDGLIVRIPVAGALVRQIEAARMARTLGTLLGNGVGLLKALSICRQVLSNALAIAALEHAEAGAKEGGLLADALARSGFFPPHCTHLLRLGAETGRLSEMALRAAEIHEEEARAGTQRLLALLVPAITIVMGLLVAAIIGSLMVAMMSLNDLVV
jgi:general secretion pathway protein F